MPALGPRLMPTPANGQAHLRLTREYTPRDMQKAVRWAIASATEDSTPSLTIYARNIGSAYQQWLSHPAVYQIARIPKAAVKFKPPTPGRMGSASRVIQNGM